MKLYTLAIIAFVLFSCKDTQHEATVEHNKATVATDTLTGKYTSVGLDGVEACSLTISISKKGQGYEYHIVNNSLDTIGQVSIEDGYLSLKGVKWLSYANGDEEHETVHNSLEIEKNNDTLLIQNYGNAMNEYQKLDCESKYIKLVKKSL